MARATRPRRSAIRRALVAWLVFSAGANDGAGVDGCVVVARVQAVLLRTSGSRHERDR
jgi:hypothetical protein